MVRVTTALIITIVSAALIVVSSLAIANGCPGGGNAGIRTFFIIMLVVGCLGFIAGVALLVLLLTPQGRASSFAQFL